MVKTFPFGEAALGMLGLGPRAVPKEGIQTVAKRFDD
jgi:hypothetical protein